MQDVNNVIIKKVKEKNVKWSTLARKTGISKQNLCRILNSNDIKISQLILIAEALGETACNILQEAMKNL